LVASLVDFARMCDFLDDVKLDFHLFLVGWTTIAANLARLFIVVFGVWFGRLRKLDTGNLKIVWLAVRCVCAEQESVLRIVCAGDSRRILVTCQIALSGSVLLLVWEPLSS
jgi:hypothetical protein